MSATSRQSALLQTRTGGPTLMLVVLGDLGALILFGVIGLYSHERSITPPGLARAVLPFVAAWFTLGWVLGAFRPANAPAWKAHLGQVLTIWAACGVVALVGRSIVFSRPLLSAFSVIALLGNGLLLIWWRTLLRALWARSNRSVPDR